MLRTAGGFEGETLAEIFIKSGLAVSPADNSRVAGWQRVRGYLADAPDGLPKWQCFSNCTNFIRTLPLLQYDLRDREDAAQGEDHAPEALRYGLMSRPQAPVPPKEIRKRAYDPLDLGVKHAGGYMSC